MLALEQAMSWMEGTWYLPSAASSVKDIEGNVISVGDKVLLVGQVLSINQYDSQSGSITIQSLRPNANQPLVNIDSLGSILLGVRLRLVLAVAGLKFDP